MGRIVGAALAVFLAWLTWTPALAAPALWRVSGPQSELYLFGTIHALAPDTAWRTPAYDAAYRRADTIWFETDVSGADPQMLSAIMQRYGVDPDRRLSQKLAPADLKALGRAADLGRIDHLRPWAAALMLSMQPVTAAGARVEDGADAVVTRAAHAEAKHVRTFESLEDQARIFAGLSETAEVRYLSDVIRERTQPPRRLMPVRFLKGTRSLEDAWLAGDQDDLAPDLKADMRNNPGLYDALLRRRNLAWAETLTRELQTPGGVDLVNVGALHMVGPDGLPALLAARGFRVERVQ